MLLQHTLSAVQGPAGPSSQDGNQPASPSRLLCSLPAPSPSSLSVPCVILNKPERKMPPDASNMRPQARVQIPPSGQPCAWRQRREQSHGLGRGAHRARRAVPTTAPARALAAALLPPPRFGAPQTRQQERHKGLQSPSRSKEGPRTAWDESVPCPQRCCKGARRGQASGELFSLSGAIKTPAKHRH